MLKQKKTKEKIKVAIIESERGWGQRLDSIKEFNGLKSANKFIEKFNADNNLDHVPDWYMYARLIVSPPA